MDTLLQNIAIREDGTIDLNELMRRLIEGFVNNLMDVQVDELFGGITPRNGYRERTLATVVGPITLKIPKLREGSYFPNDVIRPYSRTDRALVCTIAEMYVNGVSTRKVEKVAAEMGFEQLSSSQVSRMCATLDEEVEGLRSARFSGTWPMRRSSQQSLPARMVLVSLWVSGWSMWNRMPPGSHSCWICAAGASMACAA